MNRLKLYKSSPAGFISAGITFDVLHGMVNYDCEFYTYLNITCLIYQCSNGFMDDAIYLFRGH